MSEIEIILHFWTTIQAQRNRSERSKIISVYINKAISSDRRYLWQIATAAFSLRTWDSDTRIRIISSATESKSIVCNLTLENKLFGYIHYCTEISEIHVNINLLPNAKCIRGRCPQYFKEYFKYNGSVHQRATRQKNQLHLPAVRTETTKRSFYYYGCTVFNSFMQ